MHKRHVGRAENGAKISRHLKEDLGSCWNPYLRISFWLNAYINIYTKQERKRWKEINFTNQKLHNFKQIKPFNKNQNTDATLKGHKIRASLCFPWRGKIGK